MSYPHHFEVDSVEEAVTLAESLQLSDEYNIFRGQIADWPMRSTFSRLSVSQQHKARERFLDFAAFVERTPEMEEMQGDRLRVMAVAQHYGIPTILVDFTTKPAVAGWFASHGQPPETKRASIIYLAHEDFVAQQYKDTLEQLYIVRIAVDNLWRLQAQSGLFLHLPYIDDPDLDNWLAEAFGSIRFPYRGPMCKIPETAIYPKRKSRLEVLFDGFTAEQKLAAQVDKIASTFRLGRMGPMKFKGPRPAPAFVEGFVPLNHESWEHSSKSPWMRPLPETFRRQENPPQLSLEFEQKSLSETDPRMLQLHQSRIIQDFLAKQDNPRAGFVTFRLRVSDQNTYLDHCVHPDSTLRRTVSEDLADCWDGMRIFPYSDFVVSDALAYLATAWALVHGSQHSLSQAIDLLLGKSEIIEFGLSEGGQYGTVAVPEKEISAALRDDLYDLLKPEFRSCIMQPHLLLHQVNEPQRLFDFDRLVTLFGRRFIPGQFLFRQRDVVLFSPAQIERLGIR